MGPLTQFIIDLELDELTEVKGIPYALELDKASYEQLVEETGNKETFGPYIILVNNDGEQRIRFLYTKESAGDL
jgi:hypothetical protein